MFERISKYQFSVFGDFQEIALDPKVITELIDLFKDFKGILVPSAPTSSFRLIEGKSNPSFKKLVSLNFTNQDKTLVIQFNGTRIDLIKVPQVTSHGYNYEKELEIFKSECEFFNERIFNKYKASAKRIAFIQHYITKELSDEKIENIFQNIFRLDDEIMTNEKREWNFRVTNRISLAMENHADEIINSIMTFSRASNLPSIMAFGGNRLLLQLDVNTIPENKKDRFSLDDIYDFYSKISSYQQQRIDKFIKHINNG